MIRSEPGLSAWSWIVSSPKPRPASRSRYSWRIVIWWWICNSSPTVDVFAEEVDVLLLAGGMEGIEISDGDQSHQPPIVATHGQMAYALVPHDSAGLIDVHVGSATGHVARHHFIHPYRGGLAFFGNRSEEHTS